MPQNKRNNKQPNVKRKQSGKRGGTKPIPNQTVATIQQSRRKQTNPAPRKLAVPAYVSCRLNPFMGGSAMYPGGGNAPVIVLEHRSYCDIRCNNATATGLHVRVLPSGPYMSIVHADNITGTFVVSQVKSSSTYGPFATTGADVMSNWLPGNVMSEYDTTAYPGAGVRVAPYSATRARVTSGAFRVTYTGPTLNCQGLISMTQGSVNIMSREELPKPINMLNNSDALSNAFAANTTDSIQMDGAVIANPCLPSTVTVTMAAGASGTLQQIDPALPFRPVCQQGALLVADESATAYIGSATNVRGAVAFYDESWSPTDLYFSNLASGISFRIEVAMCVEYQVDSTSDVQRFARRPPPPQPSLLAKLQGVIADSVPYGSLEHVEKNATSLTRTLLASAGSAAMGRLKDVGLSAAMAAITL